ncbi:MAG: YceH family protein [Planctomycetes bacterium]|nr:YceH family protein [Planctomycetota bacterium]
MSKIQLNGHEARLLGVLFEKERTTPDQYPLSLNGATMACNQKSNRWPVTDWSEAEVVVGLQGLVMKQIAGRVVPAGSRVEKFRHNARESLGLYDPELAVLSELLMRGPQTPGELRTRASRMVELPTLERLSAVLAELIGKGYAKRIDPAPGSRAERFMQLLSPNLHPLDEPGAPSPAESTPRVHAPSGVEARVGDLERKLADVSARLEKLERDLGGR